MKTGLFLSRDDGTISETVDVDALAREYSHLSIAKVHDNFFRYSDQQEILKAVDENGLDAIVLAGNSPKSYDAVLGGTLILEALKSHGINENKIAFANIREQVALPHKGKGEKATRKAKLLIDVALARVEICHDTESTTVAPRKSVLVVGTTAGGIIAAKKLLEKGYRVYIIEREAAMREHPGVEADILASISAVQSYDKVAIMLETEVTDVFGHCGDYKVALTAQAGEEEISVGGIILAVEDDKEWIAELRPKMQLDVDSDGLLRGK